LDESRSPVAEELQMVTEAGVLAELERIMRMPAGSISVGETLESLGRWDSLAVVEFIAFADSLDLAVDPEHIDQCVTVRDLIALLGDKVMG
jgi:acyl carrier protein